MCCHCSSRCSTCSAPQHPPTAPPPAQPPSAVQRCSLTPGPARLSPAASPARQRTAPLTRLRGAPLTVAAARHTATWCSSSSSSMFTSSGPQSAPPQHPAPACGSPQCLPTAPPPLQPAPCTQAHGLCSCCPRPGCRQARPGCCCCTTCPHTQPRRCWLTLGRPRSPTRWRSGCIQKQAPPRRRRRQAGLLGWRSLAGSALLARTRGTRPGPPATSCLWAT